MNRITWVIVKYIFLLMVICDIQSTETTTYIQNDLYATSLTQLKVFKNDIIDFRIYFCVGMFFRYKTKYEAYMEELLVIHRVDVKNTDLKEINKKFLLTNILQCLTSTQSKRPEEFYYILKQFADAGSVLFLLQKYFLKSY